MHRSASVALLAVLLAGRAPAGEEAEPKPPYPGVVTADRVYVRAGDGINYMVLAVADEGDRVRVRGRRFAWLAIDVPQSCTLWVHKTMLAPDQEGDQATVARDRVNVRARPQREADIVGQLPQGARVSLVDEDGNWAGIAPPPQARAWVHSRYVEKTSEPEPPQPAAAEGMDAEAAAQRLRQAAQMYKEQLAKPPEKRDFDGVLKLYQEVAAQCQDEAVARQAEQTRQRLLKLLDLLQSLKAARQPIEEFKKKYDALEEQYKQRAQGAGER
ncbi:MAG: SH3 domain-containing protein [Candidatus Brocadiia bacterium]